MRAFRRLLINTNDHLEPDDRYTVEVQRGGKPVQDFDADRISAVDVEVMKWSNALHIHHWFVATLQANVHEEHVGPYYVYPGTLSELVEICDAVMHESKLVTVPVVSKIVRDSKFKTWDRFTESGRVIEDPTTAKELLPLPHDYYSPEPDQRYDEHYLEDVEETREWAYQMANAELEGTPGDIIYQATLV